MLQSRVNQLEKQCELKQKSLVELTALVQIGKDRTQQLMSDNQRLEREILAVKRESEHHQLKSQAGGKATAQVSQLQRQVQELLVQDKTRQEEVGRCRAQVAALSSELASERNLLERTREELSVARAGKQVYQLPRPSSRQSLTTEASSVSEMEFAKLPKPVK